MVELFQNFFLSKDLKQYRPHRRPIVLTEDEKKLSIVKSERFKRKRKLIVR